MENTKKDNLALALVLSVLVAIAGSVAWGFLYSLGWFVSIIAYATTFGMFAVYTKFAQMGKLTFVWTLVWVIILNTLASFLAIVIGVSVEAGCSVSDAFNATIQNFNLIVGQFCLDVGLGILFSVLGVVSYYSVYKRKQKEQQIAQMLEEKQNADFNSEPNFQDNSAVETIKQVKDETVDESNAVEGEIVEDKPAQENQVEANDDNEQ